MLSLPLLWRDTLFFVKKTLVLYLCPVLIPKKYNLNCGFLYPQYPSPFPPPQKKKGKKSNRRDTSSPSVIFSGFGRVAVFKNLTLLTTETNKFCKKYPFFTLQKKRNTSDSKKVFLFFSEGFFFKKKGAKLVWWKQARNTILLFQQQVSLGVQGIEGVQRVQEIEVFIFSREYLFKFLSFQGILPFSFLGKKGCTPFFEGYQLKETATFPFLFVLNMASWRKKDKEENCFLRVSFLSFFSFRKERKTYHYFPVKGKDFSCSNKEQLFKNN